MIKINKIRNIIAQDTWSYKVKSGRTVRSKILVGRPFKVPDHDWICPVLIENFTPCIVTIFGVGPVDSLMNAMTLVRAFFDKHKKDFTDDFNKPKKIRKR